ncbi:MAG: hypothetical protein EOP84_24970 [Verrucomicrobiaceae bacterium]|nr:MAG: hypothetical protein EOP84_24970 [Verrucomicrobiaceae bacterium]
MISQPRFVSLVFYGLAWCAVPVVVATGVATFFLLPLFLIQLINTFTVLRRPVRVSVRRGEIECYFPLTRTTKIFDLDSTEVCLEKNPIRIFPFSDFIVLRSRSAKAGIWRMGTGNFDGICESLKIINN